MADDRFERIRKIYMTEQIEYYPPGWSNLSSFNIFKDYFFCCHNTIFVEEETLGIGVVTQLGSLCDDSIRVDFIETENKFYDWIHADLTGDAGVPRKLIKCGEERDITLLWMK